MLHSKKEYQELVDEIQKHDRAYYALAAPLITDHAYDLLYKKLQSIEQEHPEWILPTSPTQRVSETVSTGFTQVSHTIPMLSLANTYSKEEVEEFIERVHKLLGHFDVAFCAELKMDGIAVTLRYEHGLFVRALTRGDGKRGDDITANVRTIGALPLKLLGSHVPELLEVRGEVFMSHRVFEKLNEKKEAAGEEPLANPRNAAAGSLKLLDSKEVNARKLSLICYSVAEEDPPRLVSQYAVHKTLEAWGLPSFPEEHVARLEDANAIMAFAQTIHNKRRLLPFDIDGVVIKVDDLRLHERLGNTSKSPRFAIAYKFAPEQAVTRIHHITVQVGRTGVLTPVAELDPVFLSGSTICRATLHNQEEIERKDIRVGDYVTIEKGGDVIPKVVQVEMHKRPVHTVSWKMPHNCPSCGADVISVPGEVAVRCPNIDCREQKIGRLAFFVGRDAMNIDHLGERVIEQLVRRGLVRRSSDLYRLTEKDLATLDGFKEKSIQNLLKSIEASKKVTLSRLILALGIKYVGEQTAEALANFAGSIQALFEVNEEQLLQVDGVGAKVAAAVVFHFAIPANREEVLELLELGVNPETTKKKEILGHSFSGKTFVLTGTLARHSRDVVTALIRERGGKVVGSVSSKTDYLLAGEEAGSKLDKARALNIAILTEEQFESLL